MAKKVSQYTTQATVLAAGDLIDLTKLISTGPNVYESQKADANLLAGWNLFGQDQTMPAPRLHNLGNNQLSLTNGRLLLKGSDNIATDLLKLESLAGTEVFKAQNDGTIKISNAFTLPTSDGTTGQALLTNGSGAVSFGNVATSSIYTANDTIGSGRTATITDTLTFAGGKLVLSSTNDGILLNRVDDSQMSAISATNDEIVYNTQQEGLFRWNGSSWVALSAGYGIVGTTDSTGKPTFYATVKSAYEAGQGSVKLYSDITESVSRTINIVDGRDIDLNGFSYTYSATDGSNMFDDNIAGVSIRIINGRLLRTGGTTSSRVIDAGLAHIKVDIVNVYAENTNGQCIRINGAQFDGTGSFFIGNNNSIPAVYLDSMTSVKGGTYINNGSNHNYINSLIINGVTCRVSSGRNQINGVVNSSEFYSTTGYGLDLLSNSTASNCYVKSTTGRAGSGTSSSLAINSTFISDTGRAGATLKLINCFLQSGNTTQVVSDSIHIENCNIIGTSTTSTSAILFNTGSNPKVINNIIELQGTSGKAINLAGATDASVFNNTIKVSNSAYKGIDLGAKDAFIFGNVLKGSTNLISATTGSNLWTSAIDSEGNSAQL